MSYLKCIELPFLTIAVNSSLFPNEVKNRELLESRMRFRLHSLGDNNNINFDVLLPSETWNTYSLLDLIVQSNI